MKSIRANPRNHAAEGDERIRTAVCERGADRAYVTSSSLPCGHPARARRPVKDPASGNSPNARDAAHGSETPIGPPGASYG